MFIFSTFVYVSSPSYPIALSRNINSRGVGSAISLYPLRCNSATSSSLLNFASGDFPRDFAPLLRETCSHSLQTCFTPYLPCVPKFSIGSVRPQRVQVLPPPHAFAHYILFFHTFVILSCYFRFSSSAAALRNLCHTVGRCICIVNSSNTTLAPASYNRSRSRLLLQSAYLVPLNFATHKSPFHWIIAPQLWALNVVVIPFSFLRRALLSRALFLVNKFFKKRQFLDELAERAPILFKSVVLTLMIDIP